jgi:cytochrome c oxidase assembly protein subunit 15
MHPELARDRGSLLAPSLVGGFAATTLMATAWLITHLPWLGLQEQVAIPVILTAWLLTITIFTANLSRRRALPVGLGSGIVSGLAGLVFFGSRLAPSADTTGVSQGIVPSAALLIFGFLGLAAIIGLVGGATGRVLARPTTSDQPAAHWLARFALVTSVAVAPLIMIGGLVTSTHSGMAVPDWPNSYGSNMFLYPLGAHVQQDMGKHYEQVFVEHAHRLFGAFVGLTAIVLLAFTLIVEHRRWVKLLAGIVLLLVAVQGTLGGMRVHIESALSAEKIDGASKVGTILAACHGVLAQLTVAMIAAFAVILSDHFRALAPGQSVVDAAVARRAKFLCSATLHAALLQLIFGATYRHLRSGHALLAHIGLSLVVLIFAILAGFTLASPPIRRSLVGPRVAMIGIALASVATIQFLLGWIALGVAGRDRTAETILQAVLRTIHHSNGALMLALAAAAFVWGRRLSRGAAPAPAAPSST